MLLVTQHGSTYIRGVTKQMDKVLAESIHTLEHTRTALQGLRGSDPEIARLLAIARTQIETAELFLSKAGDRLYGNPT